MTQRAVRTIAVVVLGMTLGGCGGGSPAIPPFDGPRSVRAALDKHFPPESPSPNPAPKGTGVYGYVVVSPACRSSNDPCHEPEQFAIATVAAKNSTSGRTKTVSTAPTGRFVVPLAAGTYEVAVVTASAPGLGVKLCHPSNQLVIEGSYSYIQLACVGA